MDSALKLKSTEISYTHRISQYIKRENSLRTKNDTKFFDEDNNYIDYFIEIGVKPGIFKEDFLYSFSSPNEINDKLKPQIISKFPDSNKKSITVNDIIISQIFPNGIKVIEANDKPDPYSFAIMSDNQLYSVDYKYKYISCLIIYESLADYRKLYDKYFNNDKSTDVEKFKNIYIPKCLCICSVHPCIDKFEEILKAIYENTISNKYNNLFVHQLIEELVIRTPKIPCGYKKVVLKINDKEINLTERKMNEFPLIHADITKIFGTFNIDSIIDIFKYILFEEKVIFFSSKLHELTNSIMSFLFLLSPFEYQHQVISILPKEYYAYLESNTTFIYGINEKYDEKFFEKNNILLKKRVCIVDLDEKKYEFNQKNIAAKDIPDIPKNLKYNIEYKIQEYYKNLITSATKNLDQKEIGQKENVISENNDEYQIIFYKFMVELLEEYPKYLLKEPNLNNNNKEINDMIDTNLYLNSFYAVDRDFYKKIFKTKMFKEYISKRVEPKNSTDKIKVIFFEEKINERIAEKKMFGRARIIEQNKLLSSKEYDYLPETEIIDLSNQKLSTGVIELFKDNLYNKENCLINGYIIEEKKENDLTNFDFKYYIFPSLFDNKFFLLNASNYKSAPILYKNVDVINSKLIKKSFVKFNKKPVLKTYYPENDLYLCYIILWSLSFWYIEENERDYRFRKMILILNKINYEKVEIFELLLENLIKWGATDDEIFYIYIKFLHMKLNPNYNIFNLVYPILERKEKDKISNPVSQLLKLDNLNLELFQSTISRNKETYFKRVLKTNDKYEEKVISDDVRYKCYSRCIGCGKVIDIGKICSNLSTMHIRIRNGLDMIKCYHRSKDGKNCDCYNCLRLKFRYGTELFNSKLTRLSTSKSFNLPLLTTTSLKENLLELIKYYNNSNKKLDIESFKKNHQLEFWNAMWYFELNNIDISFILPYLKVEDVNLSEIYNLNYYKEKIAENYKVNIVSDNNNIEIEKSNLKDKYFEDELCIQNVYQFAFFKNSGMISYKNIFSYEDNINYNELPLLFINTDLDIEEEDEDHTLTRSLTSNYLNNNNISNSNINYTDYNDINNSFGTNTPINKAYSNYISFLGQSAKKQIIPTLVNSSSSPSLLNNNTSINANLNKSNNYEISKKNTLTGINFIN